MGLRSCSSTHRPTTSRNRPESDQLCSVVVVGAATLQIELEHGYGVDWDGVPRDVPGVLCLSWSCGLPVLATLSAVVLAFWPEPVLPQ